MLLYGGKMIFTHLTNLLAHLKCAQKLAFLGSLVFTLSAVSAQFPVANKYPIGPDPVMTPGAVCTKPTSRRYAENIAYCERDVSSSTKNAIIGRYDKELGFSIRRMNRGDFKIDHFIPLSIGGSNDTTNLWPQHKSVYAHTDPIESHLSNLMVAGKIKQKEAIEIVKDCKLNLPRCAELQHYLESLY